MKLHILILVATLVSIFKGLAAQEKDHFKYKAGFKTYHFVDSSRVYKPTVLKKDTLYYRPIDVDVWYPSTDLTKEPLIFEDLFKLYEQRAIHYQDETDYSGLTEELAHFYVAELGVGANGNQLLSIKTNSFRNIAIASSRFPVVLYMAGFNGMGFENYKVLEKLAQSGFVVVSISSIGRYPGDMTNEMQDMMEQVYDAEFALKHISESTDFNVDLSKIGVLGCSWGGMTAAVFANKNPNIKAMVSLDGSETHYYGNSDSNIYANGADGEDNDQFIKEIYEADLINPEEQHIAYLYIESGDKLNGFTPTDEYHYYKKLNSDKYYLRFTNSEHADFVCIPSILKSSQKAVEIYGQLESYTVAFFNDHLNKTGNFEIHRQSWSNQNHIATTPYNIHSKKEGFITGISGEIFDSKSGKPLQYVNVGLLNHDIGTVTDSNGNFTLDMKKEFENDTIRISMIGYHPIELLVKDAVKKEGITTYYLEEHISELNEVVLIAKAQKKKTLGNKSESKFISTGFSYDQLGAEMGIKINIRKNPTMVDAFNFNISYNRLSATSIFRINFYDVVKKKPGKNILNENILLEIKPKQTGLIRVDLKPYDIVLHDDVIVTLEWVDLKGKNNKSEAIFFSLGLLANGTLYKKASQAKFKKYSSLGVGFNIDVRM